jgi:hypothetical protein
VNAGDVVTNVERVITFTPPGLPARGTDERTLVADEVLLPMYTA